jgi:hypothetical protein
MLERSVRFLSEKRTELTDVAKVQQNNESK